jgi:hypothetical protein
MSRERTRGFIGYKLDQSKLLERARDIQVATYDMDPVDYMKNHSVEDLVLVMINDPDAYGCAKHAVICGEGVGWIQDEYRTCLVPVSIGWSGDSRVYLGVDVLKSSLTGETVDLADFVRVFGDRLESNLSLWQSKMSDIDQTKITENRYDLPNLVEA